MSIRQGDKIIAGKAAYTPSLLDFKWADHILDDLNWIRADNFIWNSGLIYQVAYNHFLVDLIGLSAQTETIEGITITYYKANDGHKICLVDQENNLIQLFEKTGVAWYYLIDTNNSRFKLPRTKFGFVGIRNNVGTYIPQDVKLPNITGNNLHEVQGKAAQPTGATNAFYPYSVGTGSVTQYAAHEYQHYDIGFDASRCSDVYSGNGTDTLIQTPATQMYLYFFVGNFTQTALENTAGINLETFNTKQDISTAVNYNNITNCITEIPQDVKLELTNVDNQIKIKAGSKFYVPNGFEEDGTTLHFDIIEYTEDTLLQCTHNRGTSYNGELLVYPRTATGTSGAFLALDSETYTAKTTDIPSSGSYVCYDSTLNRTDWYDSGTMSPRLYTLPIARVGLQNGVIYAIDQTYTGFYYIDIALFATPGISYLCPNGRNSDGSLNNRIRTTTKVSIFDGYNYTGERRTTSGDYIFLNSAGNIQIWETNASLIDYYPHPAVGSWWRVYDTTLNKVFYSNDGANYISAVEPFYLGSLSRDYTTNKIEKVNINNTFQALNYFDINYISKQSRPSTRYLDLTANYVNAASGVRIKAPADGYFVVNRLSTGSGQFNTLGNVSTPMNHTAISSVANQACEVYLPVAAGQTIEYRYANGMGALSRLVFIFTNGFKGEY